jgi:hypothetical protein
VVTRRRSHGFLEPWEESTILACLLDVEVGDRASDRGRRRTRGAVRHGLVGLKENLE